MPQMSPALGVAVKTGARADHRPALARRKASRIAQVSYRHSPLPHSNSGTVAYGESGCLAVRSHMTHISWTTRGPSVKVGHVVHGASVRHQPSCGGAHGAAMRNHYNPQKDPTGHDFVDGGGFLGFRPLSMTGSVSGANAVSDALLV